MDDLDKIMEEAKQKVDNVADRMTLSHINATYLGKNGELSHLLKALRDMGDDERRIMGEKLNRMRDNLLNFFKQKEQQIADTILNEKLANEKVDVSIPVKPLVFGTEHPIEALKNDIIDFLIERGYELKDGTDIETDMYCFEKLNVPKDHPAREMQDTFYIDNETVLRTHTSAMQVRTMEAQCPPIKMISAGNAYRIDEVDATHSPIFEQLEILCVDENVTLSDLIGTIEQVLKHVLGEKTEIRVRPSYFPFTEPSVEIDAVCSKCGGKGCSTCKGTGYIEILGAGMVHPNVLEGCGIDTQKYRGFAAGFGLDRLAMLKYGVEDLRDMYENNVNLLKQSK